MKVTIVLACPICKGVIILEEKRTIICKCGYLIDLDRHN